MVILHFSLKRAATHLTEPVSCVAALLCYKGIRLSEGLS
jgi:hypothetical protein